MGILDIISAKTDFIINVYTGNKKQAGTNSAVRCILHCKDGEHSQLLNLDNILKDDFQRGACDEFAVPNDSTFGMTRNSQVVKIELWRERQMLECSPDWFVDRIEVVNRNLNETYVFPILRWIENHRRYMLDLLDTSLPMDALHPAERQEELVRRRAEYMIDLPFKGLGLVMSKKVPDDEKFALNYVAHLGIMEVQAKLDKLKALGLKGKQPRWESMNEMLDTFDTTKFDVPTGSVDWNDDAHFGQMRLSGCNPSTIQLVSVENGIPSNFPVGDEMLTPYMEKRTIQQAIAEKRLFMTDHSILEGVHVLGPEETGGIQFALCVPMALFYLDSKNDLKPIAIQLFQKPSEKNPIFTPGISQNLWTLVKMWYNNADCAYHEAVAHLGGTHLTIEGVALVTNRQLSLSHPIYKLLAPHFLYLIAINGQAGTLIFPGGWTDKVMNYGARGFVEVSDKKARDWRLDTDGTLPEELKKRGVYAQDVLPNYHFRNDAILLWDAISEYVTDYVNLYYPEATLLKQDHELQNWAAELVKEKNTMGGGIGMKGVPGNGEITKVTELASIVTSFIYISSVAHAAANFPQYDQMSFIPNFPAQLLGIPPNATESQVTDQDILDCLPTRDITFEIWTMMQKLSEKATESLGYFEVQYVFDPAALNILERFRDNLRKIGDTIEKRNKTRNVVYDTLHPNGVPNSISI